MKGISPLIAAVLLIAFTVAVAGIVSVFFSNLTTTTTSAVNASTQVQVKCAGSSLKISNTSSAVFQVSYDIGTETLSNVNVTFVDQNGTSSTNACSPSTLSAGNICTANTNSAAIFNPKNA